MRKVGLFLGVALFCLGGYLVYLFEFKSYDVADAKIEAVSSEEYVITLSDGSKIILDELGNLIRREDSFSSSGSGSNQKFPQFGFNGFEVTTASNEKMKASKEKVKPTVVANKNTVKVTSINDKKKTKEIKKKYEAAFNDLEEQSTARLYTLINLAKNEFNEKQAKKQKISYPYFYNKYTAAASDLEKQTDQFFYALTKSMQQELKANGMPSSIANAYTKEYESRKDKLRSELMKKAAGI